MNGGRVEWEGRCGEEKGNMRHWPHGGWTLDTPDYGHKGLRKLNLNRVNDDKAVIRDGVICVPLKSIKTAVCK